MTDTSSGIRHDSGRSAEEDAGPSFTTIGDRYRVGQRIAAGGMATVFVAEDLKHGRKVAVKVLHAALAHSIGVQRFLREIEVIARLQHPHLLTLIDSGDVGELPYYVMPYLEAQSLRETIAAESKMSFDDAIRIAREVADGLAYAHQNGVVHRDIKPSNILMSGGHAMVADFGIATALQRAGFQRLTETGISLGSPTYMSPEQAAGERDVDSRSDIYSLACVLYEMLAGQPPIDHASMQQVITKKLTDGYTALSALRPDVPAPLEAAIHRALSADRHARFATMEEFSQAIAAGAPVAAPTSPTAKWMLIAAAVVAIVAGGAWLQHESAVVRATQRVAEVNRLAVLAKFDSAFRVSEEILPIIPHDSALLRIRPMFTDFLRIVTVPAGARVSIHRLDQADSAWRFVGETPIDSLALAKFFSGIDYKVRVERVGYEPVEMLGDMFVDWRPLTAPPIDTVRLDRLGAMPGMVRIPGFSIDSGHHRFADYYIGKTEVTNREYAGFIAAGGYQKREYWTEPMRRQGRPVTWDAAMAEFHDRSGSPGPSTWNGGTYPPGQGDFPVGGVSYYEAAAYARFVGRRLPTLLHWRRAAARNSVVSGWAFLSASNMNSAQPRRVGGGVINGFGLYDVAGNVREWCVNPGNGGRLAMGGGWEELEYLWNNTLPRPEFDRAPSNGLRLVALTDADTTIAQVSRPVLRQNPRDFRGFKAVSDAEFAIYRKMFDYDHRPLAPRIEVSDSLGERFRWQRVTFTAANGTERMAAYVFLPKNAAPPFEPVIFWPAGGPGYVRTLVRPSGPTPVLESFVGFLLQSGRAVVLPVFKGAYERDSTRYAPADFVFDTTTQFRDFTVQWVNDMRRTIDYLQTRSDLRVDRLGYYGVSWGGELAPMALALETRVKGAVLNTGGYYAVPVRPEVDPGNYAPRVYTPTLLLSGQHDGAILSYEASQRPFFEQIGTPASDKDWKSYTASHILPQEEVIKETLAWFDKYLSKR
ncbi:MAG TPA: protein kinase [Gemmatimonadaceae bacterium]|jgi:dienelactone hydrolase